MTNIYLFVKNKYILNKYTFVFRRTGAVNFVEIIKTGITLVKETIRKSIIVKRITIMY